MSNSCTWDPHTEEQFKKLLAKIPVFLRGLAEKSVSKAAQEFARSDGRQVIEEKDFAFFKETPFGFQGPLKTDMKELGIDYTQYGHPE